MSDEVLTLTTKMPTWLDIMVKAARPLGVWLVYLVILMCMPIGALALWVPAKATAVSTAVTGYLAAIPEAFYAFAAAIFGGYAFARSFDKSKGTQL